MGSWGGDNSHPHTSSLRHRLPDPLLVLKEGETDAQTTQRFTFLGAAGSPLLCLSHAVTYPRQKEMHQDKLWTLLTIFCSPFARVLGDFPRKGRRTSRVQG